MAKREKAVWFLLCLALAAAMFIPVKGLLMDGIYAWHIRQLEFKYMMAESLVLFVLFSIIWLILQKNKQKLILTGVVCLVFVWCHVIFLPVIVSGLYVAYLYLMGYTIRTRAWKYQVRDHFFADFLFGCGSVITLFCLLSVVGLGSIPTLKIAVAVTGIMACGCSLPKIITGWKTEGGKQKDCLTNQTLTKSEILMVSLILVMVLIQLGRMNISIDFDSLWYGVRSEYMLNNGHGIYENMGTVGLVYTYSKGLEVLLLPLSDLASHSYLICFNVWMAVVMLGAVYRVGRCYMSRKYALLAITSISTIPAIMNMSITAKTDSMTLMVQVVMVLYLLYYLQDKKVIHLLLSVGALLLSWTLKPTAVIFSTAVFGMSFLYLLSTRQWSLRASWREWMGLLPSVTALIGIWTRTILIVGIPITSVFSSVFIQLGFQLQYPFSQLPLYGDSMGDKSPLAYLVDTVYKMLLLPVGENMDHVIFAWGTSLMFFLILVILLLLIIKEKGGDGERNLVRYAHTVLIPFTLVCIISLMMLGQIDGNYFMLLDVFIVLYGCGMVSRVNQVSLRKSILVMMIPILLLNVNMTAVSNWAWSLGFTPVQVINKGRFNHKEQQHKAMIERGNAEIWNLLAENPETRVIAAGTHPQVFDFPCNVQSYDDITSSWGNVVLVKTMDNFVDYLEYSRADYIYMQAGVIEKESRCYELMGYLIEAGILQDVFYEQGNMLARVVLEGTYSVESDNEYQKYQESYLAKE